LKTTAEVLKGLVRAYDDFEQKREEAWKAASSILPGWVLQLRRPRGLPKYAEVALCGLECELEESLNALGLRS
jgi:hypothetical protein